MTTAELQAEWDYRVEERLGIMCADAEPTPEQIAIAVREADEAVISLWRADTAPLAESPQTLLLL